LGITSTLTPYNVNVKFSDDDGVVGYATARAEVE
jgi:hypothetical protein